MHSIETLTVCSCCYAARGEPCLSRLTGRVLSRKHCFAEVSLSVPELARMKSELQRFWSPDEPALKDAKSRLTSYDGEPGKRRLSDQPPQDSYHVNAGKAAVGQLSVAQLVVVACCDAERLRRR